MTTQPNDIPVGTPAGVTFPDEFAQRLDDFAGDDEPDCYDCGGVLPGVLTDMDFLGGIQRCDECGQFDGDLDAAQAAADRIGGTVWFMAESDETRLPEGVRTQWLGAVDVTLVSGNNPWVELDGVLVVWQHTRLLLDAPRHIIVTANKLAPTWTQTSEELVRAAYAVHANHEAV